MATETLTAERILAATEDVLRLYGPSKATVVDVARALGVSHGSVYRHFRTKAALREAVTKRWLDRTTGELRQIVEDSSATAEDRLRRWNVHLFEAKRAKAGADPQLFATYEVLLRENSETVDEHIADLVGQLTEILQAGLSEGTFTLGSADVPAGARAVFDATVRFHDPVYAAQWVLPDIERELAAVLDLVLNGLRVRA
ncbi:TetR family transcriptional regulator [Streptomyces sp. TRM66268-LWL]|uniref:TetR family transcriptional regulator n=1 Tax=Streptomyces polyasparticus TaxID=2767826 RepID=A0ABR7SLG4_9ACTN|nr:TetR family transcriptional regulator [Streptomyces polyasparticus]MBC9716164.1 TetR family transcriptional regulator [Streptomyces polyasparticus]